MSFLDAIHAIEGSTGHLWEKPRLMRALMGLSNSNAGTTNRTGYYWCRLLDSNSQPIQAYYAGTNPGPGKAVYVVVDPYRTGGGAAPYTILGTVSAVGTIMSALQSQKDQTQGVLGGHAAAHEWTRFNYGLDALSIHERAISALRAQPTDPPSLYLDVNPGLYLSTEYAGGISPVFVPPAAGTALHLLYLDTADGTLKIVAGTAAVDITDELILPAIPTGAIPLVAVMLHADDTAITEDMLYDQRRLVAAPVDYGHWEPVVNDTPEIIYSDTDIVMAWAMEG